MLKFLLLFFLSCLSVLPQTSGPLTNQRIIELTHAGLHPDELARIIATAPEVSFDLTPAGEQQMMRAGVTEETIKAMAAKEDGLTSEAPAAPMPSNPQPSAPAVPVTPVTSAAAEHGTMKPVTKFVRTHHNVGTLAAESGDYLSEQEVEDAISAERRHRHPVGLTLNDVQERMFSRFACKTCGQSGYTVTIYTPFEWVETLTRRADKEMLPFSARDITAEMRLRMLRVEALPSTPDYINGAGLSWSSSVHRVVLSDTGRTTVIQPSDFANGTVESNSAFRSANFSTAAAAFPMSEVERIRAMDPKREFFVVVVGDRQNKYFKVKRKDFRALFGSKHH